jgi:hypothetical protein
VRRRCYPYPNACQVAKPKARHKAACVSEAGHHAMSGGHERPLVARLNARQRLHYALFGCDGDWLLASSPDTAGSLAQASRGLMDGLEVGRLK